MPAQSASHTSPSTPPEFRTLEGAAVFEQYSAPWDRLAAQTEVSSAFMDTQWLRSVSEAEGNLAFRTVVALEGDRLIGAAPLVAQTRWLGAFRVKHLRAPTFDWINRYEFLSESAREDVLAGLWRAWLASSDCHVLTLRLVPAESPTLRVGKAVGQSLGWHVIEEPEYSSPYKFLSAETGGWEAELKPKFKSNLRNREGRLARLGEVEFRLHRGPDPLDSALDVFYALENAGWKGEEASSIARRLHVKQCYDTLVRRAADQVWIPVLYLDARPIAAQLIRCVGERLFLLKVGFDPDLAPYSPGQLLTRRTMEAALAAGLKRFDFLGEEMVWKMDWTATLQTHRRLILCRPSGRGHWHYQAHHVWPLRVRRMPWLVQLLRRLTRWRPDA